jgi:hypothetical protein
MRRYHPDEHADFVADAVRPVADLVADIVGPLRRPTLASGPLCLLPILSAIALPSARPHAEWQWKARQVGEGRLGAWARLRGDGHRRVTECAAGVPPRYRGKQANPDKKGCEVPRQPAYGESGCNENSSSHQYCIMYTESSVDASVGLPHGSLQ